MIDNIPRISVIIVTYNQENVISRAIESVLKQKDYVYEICVSDDCSTDRTWNIVQDYSERYPGLFVLNRNNPNIMMFENQEKAISMATGDVVTVIAGDDECGEGWFRKVANYIIDKNIDYKNELLCVYGDYKAIYPNGDSYIHSNQDIMCGAYPLKLALRGLVGNRGACFSAKVKNKFKKVSKGRSYIAEGAWDRQLQIWTEKNYYIPWVANIYYARIGVSVSISGGRHLEHTARWDYLLYKLKKWSIQIDSKDCNYIEYRKAKEKNKKSDIIKYGIKSVDWGLGIKGFQFRRVLFAVLRRIPHPKPIKNFRV